MHADKVILGESFEGEFDLYSIESEVAKLREWIIFVESRVDAIYTLEKYPQIDDLYGYQQDQIVEDAVSDAEFEVGIGFVACQKFLTSVCGLYSLDKKALKLGPRHSENYTKAQLVNHAANYWKHRDEWGENRHSHRNRKKIEAALKSVGTEHHSSEALMHVLIEISPKKEQLFESLVDELEAWAYQVEKERN